MKLFKTFSVFALFFLLAFDSFGKDLSGRLGLGFTNQFSNSTSSRSIPAISLKYGVSKAIHVQPFLGFSSFSPTGFTLGGKLYNNIFYETNLNFYGAVALAVLKSTYSGIEVLGLLGAEFFIPGIDSLGLLFEAGVSANNVSTGSFGIKTVGFTFIDAGMHFYF